MPDPAALLPTANSSPPHKAFTTTDIAAAIGGVRALGIPGCSVSMPFKSAVMALVDEIEKSLMAQEHYTQFENRLIRKIGIGRPETETGSPALRALDLALETELRIAWNDGLEDAAEQQDVLTVWAALLDERTTPGCIWNHGRPLGELAETIPRHPKCRCWPKVVPHPDSRDPDRAATGAAILDDMRAEREAALGELPADANFAEAVRGPRTRPPAWRGICRRLADDWPQTNEEDHEHESIT